MRRRLLHTLCVYCLLAHLLLSAVSAVVRSKASAVSCNLWCGCAMNEKALYYVEMLLKAAEVVNRRSFGK